VTGAQEPTRSWCAPYSRTHGPLAVELANAYGLPPHPWQRLVLSDWLALGDDGALANSLCLLPVPRQNGKTGVLDPRETFGLVVRGEQILHTAQEFQTARKAFDRLRAKFGDRRDDPNARYRELNAMVDRYTTSANQMVLDLKNGGHIEFRTRGSGGNVGRGGTYDLLVVDEAQCYTEEQDAALSPVTSAAPHGSPQTIMVGTVPNPARPREGEVFARARSAALSGAAPGTCIHEWGADEPGDPSDRGRWYAYNPSLGYQLIESALAKDSVTMSPETFAREHLGWWPRRAEARSALDAAAWDRCRTDSPPADGVLAYAFKFSPDGATGCVAACVRPDSGPAHVEVVDSRSTARGIQWFVDWAASRSGRCAVLVVDGQSNAQTMVERLLAGGYPSRAIERPTARDVAAACSGLANAVAEGTVTHYGQPALDAAARGCGKRPVGRDGGWAFQGADGADACLVEACALALWAARTTKRDQRRTQEVWM
jgi:hypothetical protein